MTHHYFISTGDYDGTDSVNIWQSIAQEPTGEVRAQICDNGGSHIDSWNYDGTDFLDDE